MFPTLTHIFRLLLLLSIFCVACFAQGHAILATGSFGKDFVPFAEKNKYKGFRVDGPAPGVEAVFSPRGRVGGSVYYSRLNLAADPSEETGTDTFGGQTHTWKSVVYREFEPTHFVGGMLYVNVSPRPGRYRVEPFVGAGGGLAFVKSNNRYLSYFDGVLQSDYSHDSKLYAPTAKFVGGVNVFPVKLLMFSVLGGIQYGGPVVEIRGGLAF